MAGTFLNVEHGVQNTLSRLFEDLANQLVLEVVDKIEEEEEVVDKIYHSIHLSYVVCILKVWDISNAFHSGIYSGLTILSKQKDLKGNNEF